MCMYIHIRLVHNKFTECMYVCVDGHIHTIIITPDTVQKERFEMIIL